MRILDCMWSGDSGVSDEAQWGCIVSKISEKKKEKDI